MAFTVSVYAVTVRGRVASEPPSERSSLISSPVAPVCTTDVGLKAAAQACDLSTYPLLISEALTWKKKREGKTRSRRRDLRVCDAL